MELDVGQAIVLGPGEGAKALLDELTVTVARAQSGATPHVHREHVDVFYVLEGTLVFADAELGAGDVGYAPPGTAHWFDRDGGWFFNVHAPGAAYKHRAIARSEGRRVDGATIDTFDAPEGASAGPVVVRNGEGEQLANEMRTITFKITRPELCLFEFDAGAGASGPVPHVHRRHVDAFYVLEGVLEFWLDGATHRADAGTFVAAPPGTPHTFKNTSGERVRFLNVHAPGMEYDEYFRRQAAGESGHDFHASFDSYDAEVA